MAKKVNELVKLPSKISRVQQRNTTLSEELTINFLAPSDMLKSLQPQVLI
jgi:hypothetical protein